jgi:hypothetical protein
MAESHAAELPAVRVTAERRGAQLALVDMRLLEAEARQLAADLAAADAVVVLAAADAVVVLAAADAVVVLAAAAMPAAALAAAVTWAAAAMAAAVTGKFFFGSSPKSPSASADGSFLLG